MWTLLSQPGERVTITASTSGGQEVLKGEAAKAHACRLLSSVEDTLFTTAREVGNDWLSVWSMNPGNPDHRRTLTPRYYAHPLEVMLGETIACTHTCTHMHTHIHLYAHMHTYAHIRTHARTHA